MHCLPDFFLRRSIIAWIVFFILFLSCRTSIAPSESQVSKKFSIEELERRTFNYFWELADPKNFQIPDRYPTLTFSSIAATGFGLSAYIVGAERKYITREEAADRTLKTLKVLWHLPQGSDRDNLSGYKGFFYHFLTLDKAVRFKDVELSSIDTGLLMAGILSAMSYYNQDNVIENSIEAYSDSLYRRVEWDWMYSDTATLSMGWHPEGGFIPSQWIGYNEAMILVIMAIGSPTHPLPAAAWDKWCDSYVWDKFEGYENLQFDPLFGHQYSHVWIDFRGIQDDYMSKKGIDYFENSRRATLSNRAYCIKNPLGATGYNESCWGLTACDGPDNKKITVAGKPWQFFDYRARGACSYQIVDDGTIAPTAAGGSYAFTPDLSHDALKYMWETYSQDLTGEYGFKDAFNLTYITNETPRGWFDIDYLGIDQGPILLMIENHQSGLLWNVMKKNPYIVAGLKKAGFKGGWLDAGRQKN
ncbi:MAG TPA: glucoamylase family protein [Saprospiraceae bacterium]|nr:glucoamylase family protein [Saprospiraceae bacterium]